MTDFVEFPKIARWSREIIITEKIDGTNAQVCVVDVDDPDQPKSVQPLAELEGLLVYAGSRNRWLARQSDNFGFAKFVEENAAELVKLGPGRHYGEWWGSGIQRGYGLPKGEKRFSLFNVSRWGVDRPSCCHVVPTLFAGAMSEVSINEAILRLRLHGSQAAPGFLKPEGVVIFHVHANKLFKKTLENDDVPKSQAA